MAHFKSPKPKLRGKTWSYLDRDENGRQFRKTIGNVKEYTNLRAAQMAMAKLLPSINKKGERPGMLMEQLIDEYETNELPARYSTSKAYKSWLKNHVRPKWGKHTLPEVKPLDVRAWIQGLDLSGKSKVHIKSIMFLLFHTAELNEWYQPYRNPIELVRLRGVKSSYKPRVLTVEEFRKMLKAATREPLHTLILMAGCLGLRRSELFGLKWEDFDFIGGNLKLQRAVVEKSVDRLKSEASGNIIPIDPALVSAILAWKQQAPALDWVFGSVQRKGLPLSSTSVLDYQLKPLAKSLGLGEIGWHDFRHSYRTWLSQTGAAIEVQKDLMRHEAIATTMDVYGGVVSEAQRKAHGDVVSLLLN